MTNVKNIISNSNFELSDNNMYLDKKYFNQNNFRKISIKHILEISTARIEEMISIIFHHNTNIKTFKKDIEKIYYLIDDKSVLSNFKKNFDKHLSLNNKFEIQLCEEFDLENTILETINLSKFGWKKEAVPITQTKNTLITRIFKYLFG